MRFKINVSIWSEHWSVCIKPSAPSWDQNIYTGIKCTYYAGSSARTKQVLSWTGQNVLNESGDLDRYVTKGHLLTEETNKRCTVDYDLEWDQSILMLRGTLLCKRELPQEQKKRQTQKLNYFWAEWAWIFKQLGKVQHFYCLANANHWENLYHRHAVFSCRW